MTEPTPGLHPAQNRALREHYGAEVVAYCANLGQPGSLDDVRRRALAGGAARIVVEDLREVYLRDFVFPALRANATPAAAAANPSLEKVYSLLEHGQWVGYIPAAANDAAKRSWPG